ncbi:HYDROLASE FAMILY PROTEIN / HAD-SUPERFAMILY PROTEIN [Salix purpurea]|uniref:HYDROLASE FAMILY PROTEIN / HAD-SUPERFAMILY PROTEIN n=1 Tax=Salix purpurea TaxID=77065 RepID=A0A9Q0TU42_SALPP|nr:HYDROLASE FAMILY PROTEIN / HAD-SUPERFAMILY PROTEIN [Salix purpurea]
MRFQNTVAFGFPQIKNKAAPFLFQYQASRYFSSQLQSEQKRRSSFGIAFDIDGVLLRGKDPIGGSPQALRRLYGDSGNLNVPFLFLTNGGGIPESRRANELSELLGVKIVPSQVLQGHSSFKSLLKRYENQLIVATGKGEPAVVMSEYGFKKAVSLEEYASCFENIDPLAQYKMWTTKLGLDRSSPPLNTVPSNGFKLDSPMNNSFFRIEWKLKLPAELGFNGFSAHLWKPGILYRLISLFDIQAAFPSNRLGTGAFRIALESVFNRIHYNPLEYVSFGKPNPFVFKNAEAMLKQLQPSYHSDCFKEPGDSGSQSFKTLYMIGDNPSVDVKGAQQAGHPWFSILTRTGVFRGKHNHAEFPADLVVDTVEEAVDYILGRECIS